ncbi:GntR family transcriptional regulator [Oceanicoccus sagamiensis]|uniref:HTH gntR-type domain-containing protein n=1 Tax=Oceanicoccus sagamiensis TaxID=716816 RepID=A0A1X9NC05_9GAMM|nr:GntR family transcriptional regulator [Oceanicoccus sagamiensis]ARN74574.1 hypothetical protein BST96_10840 [Oceanicoccus sagamiensis]
MTKETIKTFALDPHSPMPLYYQVYTSITDRIATTEFTANQLLPSERLLVEQYGVSRITVSRAMDLLKEKGVIRLHHGKGHYVNRQKLHNDPTSRASIKDYLSEQGVETDWQVCHKEWLNGPDSESIGLNLPMGRKYFQAQLMMRSDGKPVGFYYLYVPWKVARAARVDAMDEDSLLTFLRDSPTTNNCKTERCLDAMLAEGAAANQLQLAEGSAMMRIDIRYTASSGTLVQAMRSFYRGDSFSYRF